MEYWMPRAERYVEPFMGSACLFFALQPACGLLADLNGELVATFLTVRDQPSAVSLALARLPIGRATYERLRGQDTRRLSALARAARFIYLNRFCFNGLYRTNLAGQFNVPFSNSRTGPLPSAADLIAASRVLSSAELRVSDFEDTFASVCRGDFVYADPPFAVSNRRVFSQYGPSPFGAADLGRLGDCLRRIDKKGVPFVVSYALCKEALEAFSAWKVTRVQTQRNISGFAKHRRKAVELIVTNIQ
jgi:DNA adenine methylase